MRRGRWAAASRNTLLHSGSKRSLSGHPSESVTMILMYIECPMILFEIDGQTKRRNFTLIEFLNSSCLIFFQLSHNEKFE